jgi:hypothetical protein
MGGETVHPILGTAPPLLVREEGATCLKGTKLGAKPHYMGSGAPRVFNEGHGCEAPKGPHYAGAHLAGRNDKHRMPLAQKVPEHWTLRSFKSVLKGFSPYTRMNDMPPRRTQTLSTRTRQTALRAYAPSDKDSLNSALRHMG